MITALKFAAILLFLFIVLCVGSEVLAIGRVFEEKSLYSYLLKAGDQDPSSGGAKAHIAGMQEYGWLVATRLVVGSMLIGIAIGVIVGCKVNRRR